MLSLNPWNILWTVVNILILYGIYRKFLYKPVMDVLNAREEKIKKQFQEAEQKNAEAQNAKKQYEDQLATAKSTADEIILKAKKQAKEESDLTLRQTEDEIRQLHMKAEKEIESEREQSRQSLKHEIAALALLAARKAAADQVGNQAGES